MKKSFIFVMLGFVVFVCLPVSSAGAEEIPIDNPGFEDPVLADGAWDYSLDNQGWGYVDNDGYIGSWNPQRTLGGRNPAPGCPAASDRSYSTRRRC